MVYHSRSRDGGRRDDDYYHEPSSRHGGVYRYNKHDDGHRSNNHSYNYSPTRRPSYRQSDSYDNYDNYRHSTSRDYARHDRGYRSYGESRPHRRHESGHDEYDYHPRTRDHCHDHYDYDRPDYHRSRADSYEELPRGRRSHRPDERHPSSYRYYGDEHDRPRREGHRSPSYDTYSPPRRGEPRICRDPGGKIKNVEMWQTAAKTALQAGAQAAFRLRNNKGDWVGEKGIQVGAAALSAGMKDVFGRPGGPSLGGLGGNDSLSASIRQSLFHEAATKALRKLASKN